MRLGALSGCLYPMLLSGRQKSVLDTWDFFPSIKEAKSLDSPAPGSACEPLALVLSVGLDCVLSSLYLTRGSESPTFQGFEE